MLQVAAAALSDCVPVCIYCVVTLQFTDWALNVRVAIIVDCEANTTATYSDEDRIVGKTAVYVYMHNMELSLQNVKTSVHVINQIFFPVHRVVGLGSLVRLSFG